MPSSCCPRSCQLYLWRKVSRWSQTMRRTASGNTYWPIISQGASFVWNSYMRCCPSRHDSCRPRRNTVVSSYSLRIFQSFLDAHFPPKTSVRVVVDATVDDIMLLCLAHDRASRNQTGLLMSWPRRKTEDCFQRRITNGEYVIMWTCATVIYETPKISLHDIFIALVPVSQQYCPNKSQSHGPIPHLRQSTSDLMN